MSLSNIPKLPIYYQVAIDYPLVIVGDHGEASTNSKVVLDIDYTNVSGVKKKDPAPPLQLFIFFPLNLVKATQKYSNCDCETKKAQENLFGYIVRYCNSKK